MDGHQLDDPKATCHRRELEDDVVPHPLPDEGAANRRAHADVAFLELHRVTEDETVGLGRLRLLVLDDDARPEADLVGGDLREVDLRELAQSLPKLSEASLNELLTLQGGLVLAVLAQVAELHRLPDLAWKDDVQLML